MGGWVGYLATGDTLFGVQVRGGFVNEVDVCGLA